jgi:hypothetical protein
MTVIKDPIALAKLAAEEYRQCYGTDLVSIIVYGSAADETFNPKKSDINLLIVLKSMDLAVLAKSRAIQDAWTRKRFSRPLFMDQGYIAGSLDSFPIEFLNMQHAHVLIYGEDALAKLKIEPADLRLQIERELKGKWLHLSRDFLDIGNNDRRLTTLFDLSLKDFSATFRAMLYLKKIPVPRSRNDLFSAVAGAYGLTDNPFAKIIQARDSGDSKPVRDLFPHYSQTVYRLIQAIDQQTV